MREHARRGTASRQAKRVRERVRQRALGVLVDRHPAEFSILVAAEQSAEPAMRHADPVERGRAWARSWQRARSGMAAVFPTEYADVVEALQADVLAVGVHGADRPTALLRKVEEVAWRNITGAAHVAEELDTGA